MSEKNVEEVKSLLKEIKSKFFESYVDYLFDDEKCNFYWNQLEEELHTGLINVINLSLIGEIETGRNITLYIITYIVK